jgi:alkaline phosphatase D
MVIHSRRDFLVASALSAGSFVISTGFGGCGLDTSTENQRVSFNHGVASGDPLEDRVILWTRVTPEDESDLVTVSFEVARDEAFNELVRPKESVTVSSESDFTLKVDFQNLEAATTYYYRFSVGRVISPVGIAKTLPVGEVASVKFALFSCANYTNGYFNAYTLASKEEDLDATLHLGDYIYEYGMFEEDGVTPAYATSHALEYGRELPQDNATELLTLQDYRKRYALYKRDSGLQAIHAKCPMIVIWDDHEIANNAYKEGAKNHNENEGSYTQRKMAALQAYFEWLPIRPASSENQERIYRSFAFGELVNLYMLDTRIIGRDKQLDYNDFSKLFTTEDTSAITKALMDENRTILGEDQCRWIEEELAKSTALWDVVAQQVVMGRTTLPVELLSILSQLENADETTQAEVIQKFKTSLMQLFFLKLREEQGDETLSTQELTRLHKVLPYNLDAWDGYGYSRERLLNAAVSLGKNMVVLSGDSHNSWAYELKMLDANGDATIAAAVEFAVTSVSSPGIEEYTNIADDAESAQFETIVTTLIDDLKYFNSNNRGYMTLTFTKSEAISEWVYVDTVASTKFKRLPYRNKILKTLINDHQIIAM